MAHSGGRMTEEDEAFEELAKRQGDWGLQGSRKHQIMRYLENDAMREVQRLGQEIEQEPHGWYIDGYGAVIGTAEPKSVRVGEWLPWYTRPPQRTEQNFCERCGKRTKDIHTCTPPQENT